MSTDQTGIVHDSREKKTRQVRRRSAKIIAGDTVRDTKFHSNKSRGGIAYSLSLGQVLLELILREPVRRQVPRLPLNGNIVAMSDFFHRYNTASSSGGHARDIDKGPDASS
jgi:hypothetical protein